MEHKLSTMEDTGDTEAKPCSDTGFDLLSSVSSVVERFDGDLRNVF